MKDYLEFVDSQNVWFPIYLLVILFLVLECIDGWFKLRRARKRIKILELEKDLLFEEQAELKSLIRKKMAEETNIEKAKRLYPIGTRYIGAFYGGEEVVTGQPGEYESGNIDAGNDYIFHEGKWAEIITAPTKKLLPRDFLEEARRLYPKGTQYYPVHLSGGESTLCTVGDPDNFTAIGDQIQESSGNPTKNGHTYSEVVFKIIDNQVDWAKIKLEDNLAKAARLYPIGTKYISANNPFSTDEVYISERAPRNVNNSGGIDVGTGYVCYRGRWAEIIPPEPDLSFIKTQDVGDYTVSTTSLPYEVGVAAQIANSDIKAFNYGSPGPEFECLIETFRDPLDLRMKKSKKVELPNNKSEALNLNLTIKKRGL